MDVAESMEAQDVHLAEFLDDAAAVVEQHGVKIFVGIDPGAEGAIGLLCGNKALAIDIPTVKLSRRRTVRVKNGQLPDGKKTKMGTKTDFDLQGIVDLFKLFEGLRESTRVCVEIAQVQVRGKGANAYTGYRVGCSYAMWPLFLASNGFSLTQVPPAVWKRALGMLNKEKEFMRLRAQSLFPKASLKRKKDHNRAEALLLAHYLRERSGEHVRTTRQRRSP